MGEKVPIIFQLIYWDYEYFVQSKIQCSCTFIHVCRHCRYAKKLKFERGMCTLNVNVNPNTFAPNHPKLFSFAWKRDSVRFFQYANDSNRWVDSISLKFTSFESHFQLDYTCLTKMWIMSASQLDKFLFSSFTLIYEQTFTVDCNLQCFACGGRNLNFDHLNCIWMVI